MTGFCPGGTGAPDCYGGPKWTPNDPMFFLHHAVSLTSPPPSLILAIDWLLFQMVDRLWAQWQLVTPRNALSFAGGSVQARDTYANYQQFPTGAPPFLHVSPSCSNTFYHYLSLVTQLGSVLPSDGLWEDVTVSSVMNTRNEALCYTYE